MTISSQFYHSIYNSILLTYDYNEILSWNKVLIISFYPCNNASRKYDLNMAHKEKYNWIRRITKILSSPCLPYLHLTTSTSVNNVYA